MESSSHGTNSCEGLTVQGKLYLNVKPVEEVPEVLIPDCPPNLHLSILHQSLVRHKNSYMIWDNIIDFPRGSLLFSSTKTNNHGDFI